MDLIKDLFFVNGAVIKKSSKSFFKNWMIIFTGFVYTIISTVAFTLINTLFQGILNIIAGLLTAILVSSLVSNYLNLLYGVIKYDKISIQDFKEGFKQYIWKIYGIYFIIWIVSYLLEGIGGIAGSNGGALMNIITIGAFVIFNPLPEVIYQKDRSSLESLTYSAGFMAENWINWIIPNLVFSYVLYKLTGGIILDLLTTHIAFNFDFSLFGIGKYLVEQIVFSFAMIYRGHLFDILNTSTRRKRLYMRKYYD